jgi:uncharacterized protein YbaP (TraB family)
LKKILLLLLCTTAAFAQQKKYQGLLWEVSGNGLAKKSYLYGSMHVSDKVSYHLSDAFFNHLLNADIVANESDPSTWGEVINMLSSSDNYDHNKFYTQFYMTPFEKDNLEALFNNRSFTLNNILSRTSEYNKEYQEETYLDMFIYRTGRKYNKRTVGLEDTKTSLINAAAADYSRAKPKEENRAALQKILKNMSYKEAMTNFYREKDLDMLDSLTVLSSSEEYLKALLYDRNIVMVKSIDSLARTGSLFAAVGAAHLPGKKGIIELLRQKGYTVKPVYDNYTDKGKSRKEQIEKYYIKPQYKMYTSADGMISLPLYPMTIENKENVQAPDLVNGGYINVKRMLLRNYLSKDNRSFDHKSLDSLFYENIPGKILEKKFYMQDGYSVYDIKNITKTGAAQHYRYYISPLEIISISMAGEGSYTRQFEGDIYSSITLKPITPAWKRTSPKKGGFSVELPSYNAVYGDTNQTKGAADATIYAYDTAEKAYYFVQEKTLKDNETLEDTEFELKRIQYEFYRQLGIDSLQTTITKNPLGVTSSAMLGNKEARLKGVVHGAKYYLLGSVGASKTKTDAFFRSFSLEPKLQKEDYTVFTDSTAGFTISVPKEQNEDLDFKNLAMITMQKAFKEQDVSFRDEYRNFDFNLPSGQSVNVMYHKYGKYSTIVPDTLWSNVRKYYTGKFVPEEDFADADMEDYIGHTGLTKRNESMASTWDELLFSEQDEPRLINEKISNNGGTHTFEADVVRKNSEQAIKLKVMYRNGVTYSINLLTPKDYKGDDPATEKLFSSFTLLEDKAGPPPADKLKLFTEDATSGQDSIREAAMAAVRQLKISGTDMPALKTFLRSFTFEPEEANSQRIIYEKMGSLKDPAVMPFLEEQYKSENADAEIQLTILEAIAKQKSEAAYKKIIELLEYDLPVPENDSEVADLFTVFEADTKNSAVLFPAVLQFYSIPEYHDAVIKFTAALLYDKAIKPKKISAYKKMVLTNARLELKREKSRSGNRRNIYTNRYSQSQGNLQNYLGLLYPFRKDKDVKPVFDAVKALDNNEAKGQLAKLAILNNDAEEQELKALLDDEQTLFNTLALIRSTKYVPLLKNISDESIAKSALMSLSNKNSDDVTITLIERKILEVQDKNVTFFFYRIKPKEDKEYYSRPDALAAVAFVNNTDGRINTEAYKYIRPEAIKDETELQQYMRDMTDAEVNADKDRATFGKLEQFEEIPFEEYLED